MFTVRALLLNCIREGVSDFCTARAASGCSVTTMLFREGPVLPEG